MSEMRDQVYALASSLARSEEATRAALETVREERDIQERKIAEAVDEDRRIRQARQEQDIVEAIEEYRRRSRAAQLAQTNTPPTPPLSSASSGGGSSNASGSMSRFSFGAQPMSRTNSTWSTSESTDVDETDAVAPYAPWGGAKNGEIDMADFGVVRPLESLVEEEEEGEQSDADGGAFQLDHQDNELETSFDESFEESDDNIALGLDIDDGLSQTSDVFNNGGDVSQTFSEFDEGQVVDLTEDHMEPATTPMPPTTPLRIIPAPPTITAPSPASSLAPSLPPVPAQHERRASMVKKWAFPTGPVVTAAATASPQEASPVDTDEEDIKPFGAWVVPASPNPDTPSDGRFPSRSPAPAPISTASRGWAGAGYNDPPASAFANPSTPQRMPNKHPNPPSSSPAAFRSFPSSSPSTSSPPVSRSAVYNNPSPASRIGERGHMHVLSSSSAASITSSTASTSSRFSFTNLISGVGSYVNPSSPAAVLCAASTPGSEHAHERDESGQWVLRAHPAGEQQEEEQRVWTTPEFKKNVPLPGTGGKGKGGANGKFVDPKRQPVPWGSALNVLDFRGGGCKGCAGEGRVIEL